MAQVMHSFSYLNLVCGEEGCTHCVPVKNPNALMASDLELLKRLSDPESAPTKDQAIRIWIMLGHRDYVCPNHGVKNLGFNFEETDLPVIELDGDSSAPFDDSNLDEAPWYIIEL